MKIRTFDKVALMLLGLIIPTYIGLDVYNKFFHPLRELSKKIKIDSSCNKTIKDIKEYIGSRKGIFEAKYVEIKPIYRDLETGVHIEESKGLYIRQGPQFIGVTLQIRCSLKGKVKQVVYD